MELSYAYLNDLILRLRQDMLSMELARVALPRLLSFPAVLAVQFCLRISPFARSFSKRDPKPNERRH